MAGTCDAKETRLKYLTKALKMVFEYEDTIVKHGAKSDGFFTHVLTKLDAKKPTDEDSIYAKSNYPVSQSIRAYLCIGLLNWLLKYLEQLSIEEESQFTQLILNLLDDVVNEMNLSYQNNIFKHEEMESQLMNLKLEMGDKIEKDDTYKNIEEKTEKLNEELGSFIDERIHTPNPNIIFEKAFLVAEKLQDINQFPLLALLEKLVREKKVLRTPKLEQSSSLDSCE